MKRLLCLFACAFLFTGSHTATYKMELSYVNMDIDTAFAVQCEDFEKSFGKYCGYKNITHSDQAVIANIWNLMDSLTLKDEKSIIDTRRKLKIQKDDEVRTACMDYFTLSLNGNLYKYEGEIRDILEGLIKENDANSGNVSD